MSNYKIRKFKCLGCGIFVTKRCPKKTKYCTLECYRNLSTREQRKTGKNKKCGWCDKNIYVAKSVNRHINFCSVVCHNSHQGRNKLRFICKICGSAFFWSRSRIKDNNPTYCSIKCRNKCPEWKTNAVIAGNLKQQHSKIPTSLEIKGRDILNNMDLEYIEQFPIENKFIVDVYIPKYKLVIQWDGDYWHGYRSKDNKKPLDERQIKRKKLDKRQDHYMKEQGYTVIRFWEHEVKNNEEYVYEIIKKTIQ